MRDSKGSKKESFGAESRGSNHYTYTSSLGRIEEVKNQGNVDAWNVV